MGHYKPNVRDLEFNLFEVFNVQDRMNAGAFGEDGADEDTARSLLAELATQTVGPIGESFVDGDRNPPVFDPATHSVTLSDAAKKSYKALWDGEWDPLGLPH